AAWLAEFRKCGYRQIFDERQRGGLQRGDGNFRVLASVAEEGIEPWKTLRRQRVIRLGDFVRGAEPERLQVFPRRLAGGDRDFQWPRDDHGVLAIRKNLS